MDLTYQEVPPTDGEILHLLSDHFDVEPEEVLRWLDTFDAEQAISQYARIVGIA
jgi:hypothetical protein